MPQKTIDYILNESSIGQVDTDLLCYISYEGFGYRGYADYANENQS